MGINVKKERIIKRRQWGKRGNANEKKEFWHNLDNLYIFIISLSIHQFLSKSGVIHLSDILCSAHFSPLLETFPIPPNFLQHKSQLFSLFPEYNCIIHIPMAKFPLEMPFPVPSSLSCPPIFSSFDFLSIPPLNSKDRFL